MKSESFINKYSDGDYLFYCPGCKCHHAVNDNWKVDIENNTISPSVLVRTPRPKGMKICHSFVKNGKIQYLNDCTHELAGKTVPMEKI